MFKNLRKNFVRGIATHVSLIVMFLMFSSAMFTRGCGTERLQKWTTDRSEVRYYIARNGLSTLPDPGGNFDTRVNAIKAAANVWGASGANVSLFFAGFVDNLSDNPDGVQFCLFPSGGGIFLPKSIVFGLASPNSDLGSPSSRAALATTNIYACGESIIGAKVDIRLLASNLPIKWGSTTPNTNFPPGGPYQPSLFEYDLFGVMAHETGHALGLNHPYDNVVKVGDEKFPGPGPTCLFGTPPAVTPSPSGLEVYVFPAGDGSANDLSHPLYSTMCGGFPGSIFQRTLSVDDLAGVRTLYPPLSPTLSAVLRESESIANSSNSNDDNFWRKTSAVPTTGGQVGVSVSFSIRQFIFPFGPETNYFAYPRHQPFITDESSTDKRFFSAGQNLEIATFMCKRCVFGTDVLGYRVKRNSTVVDIYLDTTPGIAVTESKISANY